MPQVTPITARFSETWMSWSGVVCCGRAAVSSSFGKRIEKRRA